MICQENNNIINNNTTVHSDYDCYYNFIIYLFIRGVYGEYTTRTPRYQPEAKAKG